MKLHTAAAHPQWQQLVDCRCFPLQGMGYLHAKGIVHKDLKSKNVFHDTNKVVITDFGLFGISGVVQEGR